MTKSSPALNIPIKTLKTDEGSKWILHSISQERSATCKWRKRVKQSAHYTCPELRNKVKIKIDDASFDLSLVTPKSLYNAFKIAKQTPPSAQKRFQDQFPDVQFDWNEIYSLSLKVSLETKIREFQYKVLNRDIVFTNENFFKIKMINSPQCTFCKNEIEFLEHLFSNCEITRSFWVPRP